MLSKLLKYEFKSNAKQQLPLLIYLLIATVLAFITNFLLNATKPLDNTFSRIVETFCSGLIVFFFISIVAYPFVTGFLILQKYYKSMFTDEGYLTFTLPVSTDQLLLAKIISGFVWFAISLVALIIPAYIISLMLFNGRIIKFFQEASLSVTPISVLSDLIFGIVNILSNLLIYYTAITIGAVIAKKHKILTAIGILYLINIIKSIVSSILMLPHMLNGLDDFMLFDSLIEFIINIVFIVAAYFVTRYIIENKLNLD